MSPSRRDDSGAGITVSADSDVGRSRDHNEDRFLVADLTTLDVSSGTAEREYSLGRKGAILLVADGMGGAAAGEIASQMATDLIYQALATTWATDLDDSPERFASCMREAVEEANERIHARSNASLDLQGMGTTVTLAGVLGSSLLLSQIGDSRAYLVRGGVAVQLTKDQSFVQRLIDTGRVSEEEASRMAPKNIILQALGPQPTIDVVQSRQSVAHEDTLLLCSDGLSGLVTRAEIGEIVTHESDLTRAREQLIALANSRGGPDNITVILARVAADGSVKPEEVESRDPS